MSAPILICGYGLVAPLVAPPTPAPPTPLPGQWVGTEPDGTPLGVPLRAFGGTTFTATTALGSGNPAGTQLSATIETGTPPRVVTVPHAEWVDQSTGLVRVRITPSQCPPAIPGVVDFAYFLVLRTVINGEARVVRRSPLSVVDQFVIPAESP